MPTALEKAGVLTEEAFAQEEAGRRNCSRTEQTPPLAELRWPLMDDPQQCAALAAIPSQISSRARKAHIDLHSSFQPNRNFDSSAFRYLAWTYLSHLRKCSKKPKGRGRGRWTVFNILCHSGTQPGQNKSNSLKTKANCFYIFQQEIKNVKD